MGENQNFTAEIFIFLNIRGANFVTYPDEIVIKLERNLRDIYGTVPSPFYPPCRWRRYQTFCALFFIYGELSRQLSVQGARLWIAYAIYLNVRLRRNSRNSFIKNLERNSRPSPRRRSYTFCAFFVCRSRREKFETNSKTIKTLEPILFHFPHTLLYHLLPCSESSGKSNFRLRLTLNPYFAFQSFSR